MDKIEQAFVAGRSKQSWQSFKEETEQPQRKDYRKYVNNHYMTRDGVIPFYVDLILSNVDPMGSEVKRVNELILSKWTNSGLIYIKEKAWKVANKLSCA